MRCRRKSYIKYWLTILQMHPSRFPRKIYDILMKVETQKFTPTKFNWTLQLKAILDKTGNGYLWHIQDVDSVKLAFPVIIGALRNILFKQDVESALCSSYTNFYKYIKDLRCRLYEPYLASKLPISYIRTLAACRLSGIINLNIMHNGIFYKIDLSGKCPLCATNFRSSLCHFLIECPTFDCIRVKYLGSANFLEILAAKNDNEIANFFYFMTNSLKLRSSILNENYDMPLPSSWYHQCHSYS